MSTPFLEALWAPITPEAPGGSDLVLSLDLDEIREARKSDEPGLNQGEWARALKTPQWPRVRDLCASILKDKSKDLQVACWHAEALTELEGFAGLALGLRCLEGILDRFWDTCHPGLEGKAAEERAGRMEWLDRNLALTVKRIPLTAEGQGGYGWFKWEEARAVDNLGLRNPKAREDAIGEGKLPGETFQKAVVSSGPRFYRDLADRAQSALEACQALQATMDARFGPDGPGLETLAEAIQGCVAFVTQVRQRHFPDAVTPSEAPARTPAVAQDWKPAGPIRDRVEAVLTLRSAAAYFRATEPHSPVAPLVERAASWAEMPLDAWLAEVIKDAPTLAQLRELLNLPRAPGSPEPK